MAKFPVFPQSRRLTTLSAGLFYGLFPAPLVREAKDDSQTFHHHRNEAYHSSKPFRGQRTEISKGSAANKGQRNYEVEDSIHQRHEDHNLVKFPPS